MAFSQFDSSLSLRAHRSNASVLACFGRRFTLQAFAGVLIATILSVTSSWAAFVTLKESEMDAIFSQASFGAAPVDIRYLPTITYVNASSLNINSPTKFSSLVNQFNSSTIHYAYFVDTIDWCGSTNPGTVGCAFEPGNDFVVESNFVAGARGAELLAHELGHNLFLPHDTSSSGNLMDPILNSNTTLTTTQAIKILSRPSVQTDVLGRFVQIQPVLVVASLVPEPSAILLAAVLFGVAAGNARRWRF